MIFRAFSLGACKRICKTWRSSGRMRRALAPVVAASTGGDRSLSTSAAKGPAGGVGGRYKPVGRHFTES